MLRIQSLSHRYENENLVIDDLSLEVNKGEIISAPIQTYNFWALHMFEYSM